MTYEVTLPCGIPDENGAVHRNVHLRELNGHDEDLLRDKSRARAAGNPFDLVMEGCITRIGDVASKPEIQRLYRRMFIADSHFLLLMQRIESMASDYSFNLDCPHCGKVSSHSIDLGDLTVTEQPDKYRGLNIVALGPDELGDLPNIHEVVFRQLTVPDQKGLEHIAATYGKERGSRELLFQIKSINGQEVSVKDLANYSMRVRNAIRNAMDATLGGVDTELEVTCPNPKCERGSTVRMPLEARSFFFQGKVGTSTSRATARQGSGITLTSWRNASAGPPRT